MCASCGGGVSQAAGSLNIVGDGAYTANSGTCGVFAHDPATKVIAFPSGAYASFYGMYEPDKRLIDIHDKADGFYL